MGRSQELLRRRGKMDAIGDFLTVIRNASAARKRCCSVISSNMRKRVAEVLKRNGYIKDYGVEEVRPGVKSLHVDLKYVKGTPAISGLVRCSRPGRRLYCDCNSIPKVFNNLGMCILTTPRGVLSGRDALQSHVGGELLCKVW